MTEKDRTGAQKLVCEPERWDGKAGKATGRSSKSFEINNHLQDIQTILTNHFYDIQRRHGYVTVEMVRNAYMGITQREESLLKLYEQHLEDARSSSDSAKPTPPTASTKECTAAWWSS